MNTHRSAAAFLLAAAFAAPAIAQNALGTGRGLEKDLRVGGTGNYARPDFAAEVRFRNAIVTGNAPGGMSFRSDVGYTDPDDFRGRLGSNDTYAFRRDSLYSGLGGMGIRGTESVQYQFSLATGNNKGDRLEVSRGGPGAATVVRGPDRPTYASGATTKSWDVAAPKSGSLRSPSAYTANNALSPLVLGYREMSNGDTEKIAASGLLGLKNYTIKATPQDEASAKSPAYAGAERAAGPARADASAAQPEVRSAYDDLRVRLGRFGEGVTAPEAKPAKPETKVAAKPADKANEKPADKPDLTKPSPTDKPAAVVPEDKPHESTFTAWELRLQELRDSLKAKSAKKPTRPGARPEGTPADNSRKFKLDRQTIEMIRKAGRDRTTQLITAPAENRDLYVENIREGEKHMAAERYFDAEERFARALSLKPGEVAAMAGRVHAQIGSGLFVSAAVNLRTLIESNPETAAMRYSPALLPSAARQDDLLTQLRANLTGNDPVTWRLPHESALLLAYLGYQRADQGLVREGLDALKKESSEGDELWLELLEQVWAAEPGTQK